MRREWETLSDEGRFGDWCGLSDEVADLRKQVVKQRNEIADLMHEVKELESASDLGPVVSRLKSQLASVKLARDDAMAATKRMEYRLNKALARVEELENMEVEL